MSKLNLPLKSSRYLSEQFYPCATLSQIVKRTYTLLNKYSSYSSKDCELRCLSEHDSAAETNVHLLLSHDRIPTPVLNQALIRLLDLVYTFPPTQPDDSSHLHSSAPVSMVTQLHCVLVDSKPQSTRSLLVSNFQLFSSSYIQGHEQTC